MKEEGRYIIYLILLSPLFLLALIIAGIYITSAYYLAWTDYLVNNDKNFKRTLKRYLDDKVMDG